MIRARTLPPSLIPDLAASSPWPVAAALASYGFKTFALWGITERDLASEEPAFVCECVGGGHRACKRHQPGKHPRKGGWQQLASSDVGELAKFAKCYPRGNVGVVTGKASRLIIVDIDGDDGLKSLEKREAEIGRLPDTVRSRSGRHGVGFHLWFALDGDAPCPRNSAGRVGPNVDVRGEGGYALIPGSLHRSGRRYSWEQSPADADFARLPAPWLQLLMADVRPVAIAAPKGRPAKRHISESATAGSRFIGDGEGYGGFNSPIYRQACRYFRADPRAPTAPLVAALRIAVQAAPKAPERDVSRYLSEAYLTEQAERARAFIHSSQE